MGLGKTYTGGEKLIQLGAKVNLVVCQKSKIDDWVEHFKSNYSYGVNAVNIFDLTKKTDYDYLFKALQVNVCKNILVINYELVWRRPELLKLKDFTLMLDESSLIQNDTAKRTKFISKLQFTNLILLSGTPTGGKYENLYSQLKLLGYNISKKLYYDSYIQYHYDKRQGFPLMIIDGYKNVERLKRKMREYGCHFLKTEDVLDLPEQTFIPIKVDSSKEYRKFKKDRVVTVGLEANNYVQDVYELIGDTTLTAMLYERQLCGAYSKAKLDTFRDLLESTSDRVIVFYNFNLELDQLTAICEELHRPVSVVNGQDKDLTAYENYSDSVTLIQYQAGAMGLNLQLSQRIVYYTPPLSSELYEQSKKRIHRIGQSGTCYYYNLIVKNSIEERIYNVLAMRRDYTNALFESEVING
jgi:SNF2 family DNA or RNA helicase